MAVKTIAELKDIWITGYVPTQSDYVDLFDSLTNLQNLQQSPYLPSPLQKVAMNNASVISGDTFATETAASSIADAQIAAYAASLPKSYRAILNQSGTADPLATVLYGNTIGDIIWTYSGVGYYVGMLAGAFPAGSTFILEGQSDLVPGNDYGAVNIRRISDSEIQIVVFDVNNDPIDGCLQNYSLYIMTDLV